MTMNKKNQDYMLKMGGVILGCIVVFAIIIASWIWNLMFDPGNLNVNKWATRAIFNGSISLVMMVLGFIAVGESMKATEKGKYQQRRSKFNRVVNELYKTARLVFLDPFLIWYAERQLRKKKIRHLTKRGMQFREAEQIVDYASLEDLEKISGLKPGDTPTGAYGVDIVKKDKDGNDILIPKIKDTLAAYVEDILVGNVTIDVETAAYYTSADGNAEEELESLERSKATERGRIKSLKKSFISYAIIGLIYVTLFAMLAVDKNQGATTSEALWDLILRIISATSGFISGGFTGLRNTKALYRALGERLRVLMEFNTFLDSGEYKPLSYDESFKERIAAVRRAEEEEQAKETAITIDESVLALPYHFTDD